MQISKNIVTITILIIILIAIIPACKNSSSSGDDSIRIDTVYIWQDSLIEIADYYYGVKTSIDGIDSTLIRMMEIMPCDTCPNGWEFIVFAWEGGDFYLFHGESEEQYLSKNKGLTSQDRLQLSTGH